MRKRASASSPVLQGNYGLQEGPRIVEFISDDFDNGDDVYGVGDTLTVTFDLATDRGGTDDKATSVDVNEMLTFSHALGEQVISQWSDDSTLVITVLSAVGAGDVLVGKVGGNIHVALGKSTIRDGKHVHEFNIQDVTDGFNTSHTIHRLEFGERVSGVQSPLEGTAKVVKQGAPEVEIGRASCRERV